MKPDTYQLGMIHVEGEVLEYLILRNWIIQKYEDLFKYTKYEYIANM